LTIGALSGRKMEEEMSNLYEMETSPEPAEVIRLKVDGSSSVVNTLRDQLTARGLSLICPFPALEVEIPVKFACGKEDPSTEGTIHRIGVEDDPETGLPRLRLSVRAHNTRATIIAPPDEVLLGEASRMTAAPEPGAETSPNLPKDESMMPFIGDLLQDEDLDLSVGPGEAEVEDTERDLGPVPGEPDPAWVGCSDLPLPEKLKGRSTTRRRRQFTGVASWLVVLGLAAGGVYLLDRAGVVDLDNMKEKITGFALAGEGAPAEKGEVELQDLAGEAAASEEVEKVATSETPAGDQIDVVAYEPIEEEFPTSAKEDLLEDEGMERGGIELASSSVEPPIEEIEVENEAEMEMEMESIAEIEADSGETASKDDVTLVLPTRWPAQYANAYRLRNPNGVVVDVPGGLVRKEGWLDVGREHPMVRSVKAVQRETGARFVIFVNGELPRFMTAPKTGGVSLRLYREDDPSAATERVAVLDQ